MTNRVAIEEAEVAQLRAFATTVLGLELEGRENRQVLRSKIAEAGWTQDSIPVMGEGASAPSAAPAGAAPSFGSVRPRVNPSSGKPVMADRGDGVMEQEYEVRIRIHVNDKPGGSEPVPVSVNGALMYIPREQDCWVPVKYVEVLKNAIEQVYPEYKGGEGGLGEPREVPSYPFTLV